jgi:hypothetical protein
MTRTRLRLLLTLAMLLLFPARAVAGVCYTFTLGSVDHARFLEFDLVGPGIVGGKHTVVFGEINWCAPDKVMRLVGTGHSEPNNDFVTSLLLLPSPGNTVSTCGTALGSLDLVINAADGWATGTGVLLFADGSGVPFTLTRCP